MTDSNGTLWNEFRQIVSDHVPGFMPTVEKLHDGGAIVDRHMEGAMEGMLFISLAETNGGDYGLWPLINCGEGRKMYDRVRAISQQQWKSRSKAPVQLKFPIN